MSGNCATGIERDRDDAGERDDDGDDEGEARPIDEDAENIGGQFPARGGGDTTWPGRTFWMPSMMTSSPCLRPVGDDDVARLLGPGRDPPQLDLLGGVDDQHVAAGLVDLDRRLRDRRSADCGAPASTVTPTIAAGDQQARPGSETARAPPPCRCCR